MTKRWSDKTDFCEVASPYAVLELLRERLGSTYTCSFQKGPHEDGSASLSVAKDNSSLGTVFRIHCPEDYERITRLARNIAATEGRHREGAMEA